MSQNSEYIKKRTLELYNMLPQNKDDRIQCLDIRDKIIELNYNFFIYLANSTYVKSDIVESEDKLQTCLYHFCKLWWLYLWDGTGDSSRNHFRTDISFTTFFKPRISCAIRNDLTDISYTTRRTALLKIGKELGKKWTEVTLEDLSKVSNIGTIDMQIARMVLDPNCRSSFEYESLFIGDSFSTTTPEIPNDEYYDSIEEMLIHETIEKEDKLTSKELKYLAEILNLDYKELKDAYPKALETLTERLKQSIQDQYDNDIL